MEEYVSDDAFYDSIFSLTITLCQQKAATIGLSAAKAEVAVYLEELTRALRTTGDNEDARFQKPN